MHVPAGALGKGCRPVKGRPRQGADRRAVRRRNPEAPDYMGDMNPFWQSLDQVFGQYFNATVAESSSDYTTFFHPVSAASSRPCFPLSDHS